MPYKLLLLNMFLLEQFFKKKKKKEVFFNKSINKLFVVLYSILRCSKINSFLTKQLINVLTYHLLYPYSQCSSFMKFEPFFFFREK